MGRRQSRRLHLCIFQIQYCLCQKILNHSWRSAHILWTTKSFLRNVHSNHSRKGIFFQKCVVVFNKSCSSMQCRVASYTILQHSAKVFFHQKTGHKNASKLSSSMMFVCLILPKHFTSYNTIIDSSRHGASHHQQFL